VQTEVITSAVRLEDLLAEEPPPEPPPVEQPPSRRRSLVQKLKDERAVEIRAQVSDARRRLYLQDKEVTRLTAALKKCRSNVWNQQKRQCGNEAQLTKLLQERSDELFAADVERDQKLLREEKQLSQELSEARALAAKWSSVAKRQDSMLRDHQKGDAQSIIAKHPAGEVFLPTIPPDADSDDGYEMDGPRRPMHRSASGGQEDVSLGSSDEEDDLRGGRARPPALRSPMGLDTEKDDDSASGDRSSMPSPTGESLPSPSGNSTSGRSPAADLGGHPDLSSPALSNSGTPKLEATSRPKGRRSTSDSESTSEEDEQPRGKLAMASLAGQVFMDHGKKEEVRSPEGTGKPELSSAANRGRTVLADDEAEEITSEDDDFEAETSRSAD